MGKKKKFKLFDAILATVCITLVAESVMPTAAIGISMSFGAEIMPENSCVIDTCEGSDVYDEEMYNYRGWNFNLRFSYEFSKHSK